MTLQKYALIVAGGSGSRMNSELPKQFIPIAGVPILIHTLKKFIDYSSDIRIILVLPEQEIANWELIASRHFLKNAPEIVSGGSSRYQSVKNGLSCIKEKEALVAIHDGVRPFVSRLIIHESFINAEQYGNAITAMPLKDSIRKVEGEKSKSADRSAFRLIQTPQTFKLSVIKKAYEIPERSSFTDDASVAEFSGEQIRLIEGSYSNIKITTPEDLALSEAILKTFVF
ncbi:MAG: 2-C-methyl-D-erythritol 4-phosphate cytidylyltransferase [Cytophagaceae bacterium]